MVSIPQTQIALYLHDYAKLTSLMLNYPDSQPFTLFQNYLLRSNRLEDATEEYYQRMLNTAYIFTKMKIFSIAEDYTLKQGNNFISEENLDLSFLDSKITGNKKALSKKQLLQKLRDGFHHTKEGNELYKISPTCKQIEFLFKKPTPIKVKLSLEDISTLTSVIGTAAQTFQFFSYNQPVENPTLKEYLENLKLSRHYFTKKVDPTTINTIFKLQEENNHEEATNIVNSIKNHTEKEIPLSQTQVNNILNNIENLVNSNAISIEVLKENITAVMSILIGKELPIPALKLDYYLFDSFIIAQLLPAKKITYNQMIYLITEGLKQTEANEINKYKDLFDNYRQLIFKSYFPNANEKSIYPTLLFSEYIISNFPPEDELIKIGNRTVKYAKLRNSLVHGRWNIEKDKIAFYDANPYIESETDYNWSVKLSTKDLLNYCENVLISKLEAEKPKPKQKSILEVKNYKQ